jgi:hypothetical protein
LELEQEKGHSPDPSRGIHTATTMNLSLGDQSESNFVMQILLDGYFQKIKKEKYPNTPKITDELDALEEIINAFKSETGNNEPPPQ